MQTWPRWSAEEGSSSGWPGAVVTPVHLSLPQPGVHLHFVEMGSGPAVCLCHGFPESWFSWRYQVRETG